MAINQENYVNNKLGKNNVQNKKSIDCLYDNYKKILNKIDITDASSYYFCKIRTKLSELIESSKDTHSKLCVRKFYSNTNSNTIFLISVDTAEIYKIISNFRT